MVKNPPVMQGTWIPFLGWKDPMEKEMAIHSSIFAWKSPWTEEPGGLQSIGLQRVGHNLMSKETKKEILETKSSISKRNSLNGFKGRFRQTKERIIKLEDRTMEIIKSEEKKEN